MAGKKKALSVLKSGLEKFKADALKNGWEEDEIQEKITEVYENFPWYKYNPPKKSFKLKLFNFFIYSLILYLAVGAFFERNRRLKKKVNDYIFDTQISYHTQRVLRILSLPIFKFYDLSVYHAEECLIKNPFRTPEEVDCNFCEGIDSVPYLQISSRDIGDMVQQSEPMVITDVPNYANKTVSFDDLKVMFEKNTDELDEAVCSIAKTDQYKKVSDYFRELDEKTVIERNISIEWSNCHTYGTRFYRKIFVRPTFVPGDAEIHFEKRVYMLQKDINTTFPNVEGKNFYLYQVQGSSTFNMLADQTCHFNCTDEVVSTNLTTGQVAIIPNSGWTLSLKTIGDGLNILFLSSFT